MTRMLMVQIQPYPYIGTAYLCSAARSHGHTFELLISDNISTTIEKINKFKPDLIGFSCMTGIHIQILDVIKNIKEIHNIPIILGGPHPTFFPEIINSEGVDIICRGEGEFALIELLDAIESKQPYFDIKNLWVKNSEKIYKNDLRPLPEHMDDIPLIDWSCYNNSGLNLHLPATHPIRGCPFSCTYCFNEFTRNLYHNNSHYVRHFSVKRAIEEIKITINAFPLNSTLLFTSDSFGIDIPWMEEFFDCYSKNIDLPFIIQLRPELASQKCIDTFKNCKCHMVAIGIESGSEKIRKEILNRNYSNNTLIDIANRLHSAKIKFRTYNIIGIPTETEEDRFEAVHLNVLMKTDYPKQSIFSPFPGTKLTTMAKEKGYLSSDFSFDSLPKSVIMRSVLNIPESEKNNIINMLHFFQTFVLFPKTIRLSKLLFKIPPNPIYKIWFMIVYAWIFMKSEGRNTYSFIKLSITNVKYVIGK